jgi:CRP/FNR family transcriptional regulator, nitrogen fixation regulation protein
MSRGARIDIAIRTGEPAMQIRTAAHSAAAIQPLALRLPSRPQATPLRSTSGASSSDLVQTIEMVGAAMPFARNAEIYGEGEPADYVYMLASGAVRTTKVLDDGRRQVGAFYLPGDIFGLEAGEEHPFCAEAITASTVVVLKRSALMALAGRDADAARQLWALTARELDLVRAHMMRLIRTAQERVACFLIEMAHRQAAADRVELPMSRQDIADHLGLTIETVSRTFTQLADEATIVLPTHRQVVLRNRAALARLNS